MQTASSIPLKVPPPCPTPHPPPCHIQMFAILLNNEHLITPIKGGAHSGDSGVFSSVPGRRRDEQEIPKSKPGALN